MVSCNILAVVVVVVWNAGVALGYWIGGRSERAFDAWLLEELHRWVDRCQRAEEALARNSPNKEE
jgi:hypothetical protein